MSGSHFDNKEAIHHVVEKQAQGIVDAAEIHGREIPGNIFAFADSAKECAIILGVLGVLSPFYIDSFPLTFRFFLVFAIALIVWKTFRSALLGWSRLERLHRIIAQEKWEIEHHRTQEKIELKALYEAKGFQGSLLDEVVEVLMADGDRLLKVMVEEELGLTLEKQEHPLKQATGAALGAFLAGIIMLLAFYFLPSHGTSIAALIIMGASAALAAYYEKNEALPAIVWNIGLGILVMGSSYFLAQFFQTI